MTFFAANRAALTHLAPGDASSRAAALPPAPRPIDFDDNPDVLALRSAISILQMQRARAAADVGRLSRAKDAALADPEAFMRDLAEGRVSTGAPAPTLFGDGDGEDSSSSEDDDGDQGAAASGVAADGKGKNPAPLSSDASSSGSTGGAQPPPPWRHLPGQQNVVRCPPINWSQYAVVGESLDKLHSEQLHRPTLGTPAAVGPGGAYEFKGDDQQGGSLPGPRLVGVAAPYVPTRDKIEKKPRASKK